MLSRLRSVTPMRAALFGGAAAIALVVVTAWTSSLGVWTGDPGGRILDQLQPVATALPPDASVLYRNDVEPRWVSCDGRAGTFGWDYVEVQIHFASKSSTQKVADQAVPALARMGWVADYRHEDTNGVAMGWTKRLNNGTTARAQLTNQNADRAWTIFASAPPVGQRVSGC